MPGVLSTPQWPSPHRRRIARFVLRCGLCRRGEVVGSRLQERLRQASMPLTLGAVVVWYAGWVSCHNVLLCMYKETSCLGYLLVHAHIVYWSETLKGYFFQSPPTGQWPCNTCAVSGTWA